MASIDPGLPLAERHGRGRRCGFRPAAVHDALSSASPALALTRLMGGLLSGLSRADPVTYIAVVAMLMGSALLASYLPARRATRVDPIVALRVD